MGFSVESKCRAQQVVKQATPLIPLAIFYDHAPPPLNQREQYLTQLTPALEHIRQTLAPAWPRNDLAQAFAKFMQKRWTLYTSNTYTGKKSTYPVWVLHWLTYFLNQNPRPLRPPKPPTVPKPSEMRVLYLNLDGTNTQQE